jgi:hypothetical protein
MACSVPLATAGVAAGAADVAADAAGLLGPDGGVGEFVDDEHPASKIAAEATMPSPARQAAVRVETCNMAVPFTTME